LAPVDAFGRNSAPFTYPTVGMALVSIHYSDSCSRFANALREGWQSAQARTYDRKISWSFTMSILNGLPFYLRVGRPIWVIWSGRSKIIMQNIYVAQKHPHRRRVTGRCFSLEEFAKEWKEASSRCWSF
jgi:hypothetical protein